MLEIDRVTRARTSADDESKLLLTMLPHPPLWLILLAFVCALGPLVFFHELGHYLVARMFKIPAETFSIGFGREILGWTDRQGTRWKVAWLPLGGYVKFVGDMSPASDPGRHRAIPEELRDRAFQLRPVWQRFLVVLAGRPPISCSRSSSSRRSSRSSARRVTNVVGKVTAEYAARERPDCSLVTGSSRWPAGPRRHSAILRTRS